MFWRRRSRLDEEVEAHLAEEIADNLARGMDPEAARAAALRTFGNVEAAKETVRERDRLYWLDTLGQDVRFAFRLMARNRWLSATIVATLTVGIALNVSVFSLLNSFLLKPWVRSEPETIVDRSSRLFRKLQPAIFGGRDLPARLREVSRFGDVAHRAVRPLSDETHTWRAGLRHDPGRPGLLQYHRRAATRAGDPGPLPERRRVRRRKPGPGHGSERDRLAHSIQRRQRHCRPDGPRESRAADGRGGCAEFGVPRPRQRLRSVGAVQHARAAAPDQRFLQRCPCPMARTERPSSRRRPAAAGGGRTPGAGPSRGYRRAGQADDCYRHGRCVDKRSRRSRPGTRHGCGHAGHDDGAAAARLRERDHATLVEIGRAAARSGRQAVTRGRTRAPPPTAAHRRVGAQRRVGGVEPPDRPAGATGALEFRDVLPAALRSEAGLARAALLLWRGYGRGSHRRSVAIAGIVETEAVRVAEGIEWRRHLRPAPIAAPRCAGRGAGGSQPAAAGSGRALCEGAAAVLLVRPRVRDAPGAQRHVCVGLDWFHSARLFLSRRPVTTQRCAGHRLVEFCLDRAMVGTEFNDRPRDRRHADSREQGLSR